MISYCAIQACVEISLRILASFLGCTNILRIGSSDGSCGYCMYTVVTVVVKCSIGCVMPCSCDGTYFLRLLASLSTVMRVSTMFASLSVVPTYMALDPEFRSMLP